VSRNGQGETAAVPALARISGHATRTLLGVVAMFEPVNGYLIRRELVSWGAAAFRREHA
jgi:hypothetical protein